jgi:hypothetical protein
LSRSSTTVPVNASVGVGALTVYVPSNADLMITTHVGVGSVAWQGFRGQTESSGRDVDRTFAISPPDATTSLVLDLSVDVGRILIVPTGGTR